VSQSHLDKLRPQLHEACGRAWSEHPRRKFGGPFCGEPQLDPAYSMPDPSPTRGPFRHAPKLDSANFENGIRHARVCDTEPCHARQASCICDDPSHKFYATVNGWERTDI